MFFALFYEAFIEPLTYSRPLPPRTVGQRHDLRTDGRVALTITFFNIIVHKIEWKWYCTTSSYKCFEISRKRMSHYGRYDIIFNWFHFSHHIFKTNKTIWCFTDKRRIHIWNSKGEAIKICKYTKIILSMLMIWFFWTFNYS